MNNSMYSNIENTDDDIFSSAMEDAEIVDNPFVHGGSDGEPLHASDAASRLLDTYDNEMSATATSDPAFTPAPAPNSGNSLLERIQQQKKQQQQQQSVQMTANSSMPEMNAMAPSFNVPNDNEDFGYPMVQEGSYSTTGPTGPTGPTGGVHIPQYSQVPAPSAYNTNTPYIPSGPSPSSSTSSDSIDYKGKFMSVLSVVGSAAGTVAKSAYQGGKVVYSKMTNNNASNGMAQGGGSSAGVATGAGAGMTELDYQRESLLMDPHDLESSTTTTMNFGFGSGNNVGNMNDGSSTTETAPSGMRAGIIRGGNTNENSVVTFLKQFVVDMKDLFLSASPRVQIGIVVFIIFLIWLIFFE